MKALIITAAGTSSRFEESLGFPCLKCIYSEGDERKTLLYRVLSMAEDHFDKIVIVGGYRMDDLRSYVEDQLNGAWQQKMELIENPHFEDKGSGWSLYLGIQALRNEAIDSLVFVEGDLYFDEPSFDSIIDSAEDVITCNSLTIDAARSVAFYTDIAMHPHYVYDTSHGAIEINEPFTRIYDSGQVWAFKDFSRLLRLTDAMSASRHAGTNLELINEYFSDFSVDDLKIVRFKEWINCNRADDYRRAFDRSDR